MAVTGSEPEHPNQVAAFCSSLPHLRLPPRAAAAAPSIATVADRPPTDPPRILPACREISTSRVIPRPTGCSTPIRSRSLSGCCSTSRCRWSGRSARRPSSRSASADRIDAGRIAAMPLEELEVVFKGPPGAAPLPRIDGQAHAAGVPAPRRAPRRPRRGPVGGRRRRQGPVQAAQRAAGLRQGEGEDLHGAARQAVRHQAGRLGGGGGAVLRRRAPLDRRRRARPPRCSRCARGRRRRRRRARARPSEREVGRAHHR